MSSRLATPFRKLTLRGALGLVPLGASCAASPPPATPPAPAPTIASTPSAPTTLPIATTPSGTAPGDACSPEGATQNADACQKSGGMCAFSTCENGHWAWHEVPPRPQNIPPTGPGPGPGPGPHPGPGPTPGSFTSSAAPADLADGGKPFSIAMWIKPKKSGGTLAHVSSGSDGTGWCTPFLGYDDSGRIVSQVLHGNGSAATEFDVAGAKTPPVGRWSHVAMTWEPGASNRLYLNGVEAAATASPTYHASGAGTPLMVTWGASNTNGATCWQGAVHPGAFDGSVRGMTVRNRALTAAEVVALAKAKP